jgi:hypothetical protein
VIAAVNPARPPPTIVTRLLDFAAFSLGRLMAALLVIGCTLTLRRHWSDIQFQ